MQYVKAAVRGLRYVLSRVPLFGRLIEVPRDSLYGAVYETLTMILFGTMPFWILPALGVFLFNPKPSIQESFSNGEGLIYASVLLGPLFYVLTKRYGRWALTKKDRELKANALTVSFPYGGAFVAITALSCVVSGFAFALLRTGLSANDIDRPGIQTLSWLLVIASTAIFFLIAAYRNMLDDLASNKAESVIEEQPREETAFFNKWLGSK